METPDTPEAQRVVMDELYGTHRHWTNNIQNMVKAIQEPEMSSEPDGQLNE